MSGSALRGTIHASRVASLHAAHAADGQRKKHTHNAHNARNAQHSVREANLETYFRRVHLGYTQYVWGSAGVGTIKGFQSSVGITHAFACGPRAYPSQQTVQPKTLFSVVDKDRDGGRALRRAVPIRHPGNHSSQGAPSQAPGGQGQP